MSKHDTRLPIYDQTSDRWIATEAYKQALLMRKDLRHKITGAQYGKGPPDEGSIILLNQVDATVYFNAETGLVFIQLPDEEEEHQVGPREI